MTIQLSAGELSQVQAQLRDYAAAQDALAVLARQEGRVDRSIEALLLDQFGGERTTFAGDESLWAVTQRVLREELCGDEGFRGKIAEYSKEGSAPFLVGAITYVAAQMTLPIPIDPGIATLVVLYVSKVGLTVFCEYVEPDQD